MFQQHVNGREEERLSSLWGQFFVILYVLCAVPWHCSPTLGNVLVIIPCLLQLLTSEADGVRETLPATILPPSTTDATDNLILQLARTFGLYRQYPRYRATLQCRRRNINSTYHSSVMPSRHLYHPETDRQTPAMGHISSLLSPNQYNAPTKR
jgi:hypothetical protein